MSDPGGFLDGLATTGNWGERLARIGNIIQARRAQTCGIPGCCDRITEGTLIEQCREYGWCHPSCLGAERRRRGT